jgi:hypothetical protein
MNTRRFVRLGLVVSALVMAGCSGKNSHNGQNPDGGSGSNMGDGGMLPDGGPCTPGAMRCNGSNVEQCNGSGTMWTVVQMCTTFCADSECALPGLDVTGTMALDGIVHVEGAVDVHDGGTIDSATGVLTIFADSITVEVGGAITMAATGTSPQGAGNNSTCTDCDPGPGTYTWVSTQDSNVFPGSPGGAEFQGSNALGGGVLKLLASTIDIGGSLTANGESGFAGNSQACEGGGGASGGGILLLGNSVTVTGSIAVAGGPGGPAGGLCPSSPGQPGGDGRVKILYGTTNDFGSATITGSVTSGLAPPFPLASSTHPDPTLVYNDNFVSLDLTWTAPFAAQGYYVLLDNAPDDPPTAANGTFQAADQASFSTTSVSQGPNYIHIVSEDQQSNIGAIESNFEVQINTEPPSVSSSSNPSQTTFYETANPFFSWSYPQGGGSNVSGVYYVVDHLGLTVPATTDTLLPATQTNLQLENVAAGVWVLHVVSADSQGRLTKAAGNYRFNIGADPGTGGISGSVTTSSSQPVVGATVSVNDGLYSATTNSAGDYSITTVTAGDWTVTATSTTLQTGSAAAMVGSGMTATANIIVQ